MGGAKRGGLSPASIVRLVAGWQDEYPAWSKRDLRQEEIVCNWDRWDLRQRATDRKPAVPVGRHRRAQGWDEGLARDQRVDRESELSSPEVLPDFKRWSIKAPPKTGGR
jgi:hypothetical protein